MYIKSDSLFNTLYKVYKKGDKVDIATFSVYVDITEQEDWSTVYGPSPVRAFLNKIDKRDLRLVVGLPQYRECKAGCMDCRREYNKGIERTVLSAKRLKIETRYHDASHFKYYRIGDRIFTGGINLTTSDWVDVCLEVTDPEQKTILRTLFEKTWDASRKIVK